MKPIAIKAQRRKEVRKLIEEREQLNQQSSALGYRELAKPIRHGWYIELVLLPQLERYKVKLEVAEIYKKLGRCFWGRTKELARKRWDSQTSKHMIYRDVPTLSKYSYRKLSDKAKRLCTPFVFYDQKKRYLRYYVRIPKHAYRIKFTRAYTTHSKIIDPNIEERLDLIEQQLLKSGWYGIRENLYPYHNRWSVSKMKKDRIKTSARLRKYKYTSLEELIKYE